MTGDDISWMAVDILTRFWPGQGFPEMHVADLVFEYLGDEVDDVPYELNCSLIEAVRKENRGLDYVTP